MRALRNLSYLIAAAALVGAIASSATRVMGAQEATKGFVMHPRPKPVAAISFADAQGQAHSLSDFKGKIVVLNVWATWCVPCRAEMPTLDRLQAALGGADFVVVPVSIDRGGIDVVSKFYAGIGVKHLPKYIDTSGQVLRAVGAIGLPTTLIINRAGDEVGRALGQAEWDAPEIIERLKTVVAGKPNGQVVGIKSSGAKQEDTPDLLSRGIHWLKALIK